MSHEAGWVPDQCTSVPSAGTQQPAQHVAEGTPSAVNPGLNTPAFYLLILPQLRDLGPVSPLLLFHRTAVLRSIVGPEASENPSEPLRRTWALNIWNPKAPDLKWSQVPAQIHTRNLFSALYVARWYGLVCNHTAKNNCPSVLPSIHPSIHPHDG